MILDSTVMNKEIKRLINEKVGAPFSLLERFRMNGIGSHRMIIDEFSDGFKYVLHHSTDLNYCNFELRPEGILVHINKRYSRYSWVIPYFQLVLFQSKTLSIHAAGEFLKIRMDKHVSMNKKHIRTLLKQKEVFSEGNSCF